MLASETVARRDAGPEPTWTYLRRVSEASIAIHVRRISQCPAPFPFKAGTLRIKGDKNNADCANRRTRPVHR